MDVRSTLATKRDGGRLSPEQIGEFIAGYVAGEISDYHASALLMAIFIHGMEPAELEPWTREMLESGRVMSFPEIDRPKVDKHSTGGVGDKVSIPLAPAAAACGLAVPMISGRGLGHTGGTLDKLESIPGFRTDLDEKAFAEVLRSTGVAFGAQTADLVPADKKLYALRDVTGLVASIPLIASSIMSKKLAEGLDALVLDVKFGSGAFLPEVERGAQLGRTMSALARDFGVRSTVYQTDMGQPLGRAAGHALEIKECIDCLHDAGPPDLRRLVCVFGGEMLYLGRLADSPEAGEKRIESSLRDGSALEVFARVIEAQGGDPRCLEHPELLASAPHVTELRADRDGVLDFVDTAAIGLAIVELGGGRKRLGDEIDPAVGTLWHHKQGAALRAGEPVVEIHYRDEADLERARVLLERGFRITDAAPASALVLARSEA